MSRPRLVIQGRLSLSRRIRVGSRPEGSRGSDTSHIMIQHGSPSTPEGTLHPAAKVWMIDGLTPAEKLVLLCLANRAGISGECWPSQSTIAEDTGYARQTVNRLLTQLEHKGYISRRVEPMTSPNGDHIKDLVIYQLSLDPVTEDDTPCHQGRHPLSSRMTPPVTEGDINYKENYSTNHKMNSKPRTSPRGDGSQDEQELFEEVRSTWNDLRGPLPRVDKVSRDRARLVRRRLKEYGRAELLDMLRRGARAVSRDELYIERGYGLTQLLRHLEDWSERSRYTNGASKPRVLYFTFDGQIYDPETGTSRGGTYAASLISERPSVDPDSGRPLILKPYRNDDTATAN